MFGLIKPKPKQQELLTFNYDAKNQSEFFGVTEARFDEITGGSKGLDAFIEKTGGKYTKKDVYTHFLPQGKTAQEQVLLVSYCEAIYYKLDASEMQMMSLLAALAKKTKKESE